MPVGDERNAFRRLKKDRYGYQREEYDEAKEFEKELQQRKTKSAAEAMMERMGYKSGTGLGRDENQREKYDEEKEFTANRQSRHELLESDDDFEEEPQQRKPKNLAEAMMAKMGYKPGNGLGMNNQGRSEPVALSTQRGRDGLGNSGAKAIARDFNKTRDDPQQSKPKSAAEAMMERMGYKQGTELVRDENQREDMKIEKRTTFCAPKILTDTLEGMMGRMSFKPATGLGKSKNKGDERNALRRLKRVRDEDQREEYDEEKGFTVNRQPRNELLESDDDFEEEPQQRKPKNLAEAMMAKMGYKPGNGLGMNNQGRSEPVALSTQRRRDGLGNSGAKAIARDFNKTRDDPQQSKPKSAAEAMMERMGYKRGEGLGINNQGRSEPVALSTQRGRAGLGNSGAKAIARDFNEVWDDSVEEKTVEEYVSWFSMCRDDIRENICKHLETDEYMIVKEKNMKIEEQTTFCDSKILIDMLEAKNVFDQMSDKDLREARTRANPYETIGSAFFQNRAAMKTANMDKIYYWILSQEKKEGDYNEFLKKNPLDGTSKPYNIDREKELFYFADVCAGPGGFSEYMLWRKAFYNSKGFGFTLTGKDDFKLGNFRASSSNYFEPFYGVHKDGNVMDPENIDSLEEYVLKGTDNLGVHLMMADGAFSVEGRENIQEILSKRLYLCQFLVSLCIVREGGNFFCNLFDIFTPFSVALIYLMRVCYDEISLHKPHTSRPANSERYITCKGLRKRYSDVVRDYLKRVNVKMESLKKQDILDVEEILPLKTLEVDELFFRNIVEHNELLARRQTVYLQKYRSFAKNQGQYDKDQGNLRDECLKYWMVPNKQRTREREDYKSSINPEYVIGELSPIIFQQNDYSRKAISFSSNILGTDIPGELSYASYKFVRLASNRQPTILVSSGFNKFITNARGDFQQMDQFLVRIPDKTILLVEEVDEIEVSSKRKIHINGGPKIIRIIDAAVLNGDDVSKLRYEVRLKAAKKFCKALRLVNRTVKKGWGRMESYQKTAVLTVAEHYGVEQLDEVRENFDVITHRADTSPVFKEDGFTFVCSGLRFNRILKEEWKTGWSKTAKRLYAYYHDKSYFETEWRENCLASFWDTAILTKKKEQDCARKSSENHRFQVPSCIWSWKNYQDEYHEGKPTFSSILQLVEQVNANCGKK